MPRRGGSNNNTSINLDFLDSIPPSPEKSTPTSAHTSNARKRPRVDSNNGDITTVNSNAVLAAKRLAATKKLKKDDMADYEAYLNDSAFGREARTHLLMLQVNTKLDKIISSQPTWEPSSGLMKNINSYVASSSLSTSLLSFRGDSTRDLVVNKLISLGLDIPENIRQDAAAIDRLNKAVEEAFTQRRSSMKKIIRDSMYHKVGGSWVRLDDQDCTNIYDLTKSLVHGTHSSLTAELCARVAIFRMVYVGSPGKEYWVQVDGTINGIRKKYEYKRREIAKAVKFILEEDRQKYGINEYTITDDDQTDIQNEVDQLIQAQNLKSSNNDNDEEIDAEINGPENSSTEEAQARNDGEPGSAHSPSTDKDDDT
ncbi:hypothetical protein K435DRAFT_795702 [Dendrothele bispora CBS 962.96]|uniref:Uncharacterized protein n=1 Tax=Dendrothele bispora (strain CBS 962.96) TaxID=1314807 RepID=A0A4S8M8I3_DENBC|nr:hypothetical protein K435DRAFT_795702 [Dendrothele bispora CBS 962.96]